jgi:anthranilate phosphoribosyltransferase
VPTAFNYLGPLTNPARPASLAVGVADPRMGAVLAGVYAEQGKTALVFHGDSGIDELSTTGPSTVWLAADGAVSVLEFDPAALGLPTATLADLRGGDPGHNAAVARAALAGQAGPVRDIVLLNASAAIAVGSGLSGVTGLSGAAGADALAKVLGDGLARAAEAIDSGAATALLDRWIQTSNRLATPRPRG